VESAWPPIVALLVVRSRPGRRCVKRVVPDRWLPRRRVAETSAGPPAAVGIAGDRHLQFHQLLSARDASRDRAQQNRVARARGGGRLRRATRSSSSLCRSSTPRRFVIRALLFRREHGVCAGHLMTCRRGPRGAPHGGNSQVRQRPTPARVSFRRVSSNRFRRPERDAWRARGRRRAARLAVRDS
jgi:hypothetical protein